MKLFNIKFVLIVIVASVFTGCVAVQPFPHIARAGDTVTLAVGSLDGANRNNVTVTYFADLDLQTPIDMTSGVRSVLKIFPDKTSSAYWDTTSGFGADTMTSQSNNSNHGPWQSVVVLDLLVTAPVGTGHFEISFGPGVSYPLLIARVDDVDIRMEILADVNGNALVGESHDFEYRKANFNTTTNIGDLTTLEPLKQVIVKSPAHTSRLPVLVGAVSYEIDVPVVDSSGNDVSSQVLDSQFTVVLGDRSDYFRNKVNLNWKRTGSLFKVLVTSINGQQDFYGVRYSILIIDESLESTNGWSLGAPSLTSLQLFDVNGNDISGSSQVPNVALQ